MTDERHASLPGSSDPEEGGASLVLDERAEVAEVGASRAPAGILLVDDHPENLVALRAVLEPLGERLISADSGEKALRALIREDVAVILLDVRMSGLDGLQTAQLIRSRPRTRHIPIIFLTAQARDVSDIVRAYATGAVDYVTKPFEPEILRAKVAVFVELNRERSERIHQSRARARAETAARTVRTLQILSDAALAHLELDSLSDELAERVLTLFKADGAALLLRDEETPGLLLQSSRGGRLPLPRDGRLELGKGTLGRLAAERRRALIDAADVATLWPNGGGAMVGGLLVVPLVTADQLLGLLLLTAPPQGRFESHDLELLTLAADRMAVSIDHVQRFAQGRQLVETLQRSLLPERLPRSHRLELAARYLPSGVAPQIGGDWYDALALDGERTAVMIGDVVGHGVRAATGMSELRNALRAFALEGHSPGVALGLLDGVAQATHGTRMVATVLFLIVDAAQGTITLARAGHPPPALRGVDGTVTFLETDRTLPLGVGNRLINAETEYPIAPGETLLLFTDGLIERRRESIDLGFERLERALACAPEQVEQLCDHVLEHTILEQPSHDDVALLAVRLLPADVGPLELTLAATAASIPLSRHRLRAWLSTNLPELDPMIGQDLELVWSEAVSNAVRHAYGPGDATFTARALVEASVIVLEVSDSGQWREPSSRRGGRGLAIIEQLVDELVIDRSTQGTTVRMCRRAEPGPADVAVRAG
jgi:serine phosphatase RsbU (regulator of sigma subunit)/CheY-like chemotaxis protein/anti-sigma regulatory factor (Ser/Thr protein kinase)